MYEEGLNKWGFPQKYKDIYIYPIKLIDEKYYSIMCKLLAYPKNSIQDKDIMKASYLSFVINVLYQHEIEVQKESNIHNEIVDFLKHITKMDCHINYIFRNNSPKSMNDIKYTLIFSDEKGTEYKISENEFDEIREIILEQNSLSLDYINEFNPDLEEKLNKIADKSPMTFEESLFAFCDVCGISINDINGYTYYQFNKHYERTRLRFEFETFKPLEVSGQIKLKTGEIKHWLSHMPKRTRYSDILIKKQDYVKNSDIFSVTKQK